MSGLKLSAAPSEPERERAPAGEFWFVVAVDRSHQGWIVDHHADAFEMLDGAACDDNGVEYPSDPGLYRLTNLQFRTYVDWETGLVDEWGWNIGPNSVETLWEPTKEDE